MEANGSWLLGGAGRTWAGTVLEEWIALDTSLSNQIV